MGIKKGHSQGAVGMTYLIIDICNAFFETVLLCLQRCVHIAAMLLDVSVHRLIVF